MEKRHGGAMLRILNYTIPVRWVKTILLSLLVLFVLSLGGTLLGIKYLSRDLPSLDALQTIDPSVKTVIFAANGDTLREFYTENRTIVPLSRIPVSLQEAVISVEDRRFYQHYGIDLRRLVGVVWINLTTSRSPGASTLTQQLARNLFPKLLPSEKRITRKFREWIVAVQIESIYTKDEILAMYLNQIYLGKGAYGVQAAAHTFFGKDVWDLGPPRCTMIAGMIQLPEALLPLQSPGPGLRAPGHRAGDDDPGRLPDPGRGRDHRRHRGHPGGGLARTPTRPPASPPTSSRRCARNWRRTTAPRSSTRTACGSGPPWCPSTRSGWKRPWRPTWPTEETEREYPMTRALYDSLAVAGRATREGRVPAGRGPAAGRAHRRHPGHGRRPLLRPTTSGTWPPRPPASRARSSSPSST